MSDYQAYHHLQPDEFSEYDPNMRELRCKYCGWEGTEDELTWSKTLQEGLCPMCSDYDFEEVGR